MRRWSFLWSGLVALWPVPAIAVPLFPHEVGVSWMADWVYEHQPGDAAYDLAGWRVSQGRAEGALRLGSWLVASGIEGKVYPVRIQHNQLLVWRYEHEHDVSALWVHDWGEQLSWALGPVAGWAYTGGDGPTSTDGSAEQLGAGTWRLALGALGRVRLAPVSEWPLVLDAEASVRPWLGFRQGQSGFQWSYGAGVRWYVVPGWALEGRYVARHATGETGTTGQQGIRLGGVAVW